MSTHTNLRDRTGAWNHGGQTTGLSIERTGVKVHLPPFRILGNFVHHTLPVSSGRDTISHWSLLPFVYARGSKINREMVKTCCGLTEPVVSIYKTPSCLALLEPVVDHSQ